MTSIVKEEISKLNKMREYCVSWLEKAPREEIRLSGTKEHVQYYMVDPMTKKQEYIGKTNSEKLKSLIQKRYMKEMLRAVEKQIYILEKYKKGYHEIALGDCYQNMDDRLKKYVNPLVLSDEDYAKKWNEENEGEKNPIPVKTDFYTEKGENVRSRIEMHIGNRLKAQQIPYKYEPQLVLENGEIKYPDFMILNKRTRKVYYWEHLGLMDNLHYVEKNIEKIGAYERNGILIGKNLIITMESESNPVNSKTIDKYIKEYLY